MNTLSSVIGSSSDLRPVTSLEYRDVRGVDSPPSSYKEVTAEGDLERDKPPLLSLTEAELAQRLLQATTAATQELEKTLRDQYERQLEAERARIAGAIANFERERSEYYSHVEPELVHLVLAVAAKILHREAQVDRMLLAALAKVAVENLQQRSHVVIRLPAEACEPWRRYFATHLRGTTVDVLEDSQLHANDCVLETELGTAEVSIDAQLKEIERGFFDLLAKRPEPR